VIDSARKRIGKEYERIAAKTDVQLDQDFLNELAILRKDARDVLVKDDYLKVEKQIKNVLSKAKNRTLSGDVYQSVRKGPLRDLESGGTQAARFATDFKKSLDSAFARSVSP